MDSFQNCGEIEDGHPTRIQWIFEENAAPFGCLGQHGAASDSMLRTLKTPWAPCGTANHLAAGSLGQMEVHGCSRVVQWVLLYYLPRCVLERVAQWSDAQDLWQLKVQPSSGFTRTSSADLNMASGNGVCGPLPLIIPTLQ